MNGPTFTVTRVHDDDESFWDVCCDACPWEGYAYLPDEIEYVQTGHAEDAHAEVIA